MNLKAFVRLLGQNKLILTLFAVIFLAAAAVFTFVQPLEYKGEMSVLLVEDLTKGYDPYNAIRANERLVNALGQAVRTNTFMTDVFEAGFNIEKDHYGTTLDDQTAKWRGSVSASPVAETNLLVINAYHTDKYQLDQLMRAIEFTLKAKHRQYHGGGEKVELRIADKPVYSNLPARPSVPFNLGAGLALGLLVGMIYVYLKSDDSEPLTREQVQEMVYQPRVTARVERMPVAMPAYTEPVRPGGYLPEEPEMPVRPRGDELDYEAIVRRGSVRNVLDN